MAAYVDTIFPINFNTGVMSVEMGTAIQMLEEAGNYHFIYITRLKSVQTILANMKSKNHTLGSVKAFSKTFKEAFPKGIDPATADFDIVRVFSKIAGITQQAANISNEEQRSQMVQEYIKTKIARRQQNQQKRQQEEQQEQSMDNCIDDNGASNDCNEMEEKEAELLENTCTDGNDEDDVNTKHERKVVDENEDIDEFDKDVSGVEQEFANMNISGGDNYKDKTTCQSLEYWQNAEKLTKKEIKIGMGSNRKNFPHLESNHRESRHVLAREIYYAYLKMDRNPQRGEYDAYPRSSIKLITERQVMLMMVILDCKEFDRLFDAYSGEREKLDQECKAALRKLKDDSKWKSDKKVRANTKLPFIFHWYRCTFDSFWGSVKLC